MKRFLAAVLSGLVLGAGAQALTLEELAAQPALWPGQVVVQVATKATVIKDGKPAGAMLLGAGKAIVVTGVSAAGVTGRSGGVVVLVPEDKTDLFWQVGKAHPEHATAKQKEAAAALAPIEAALRKTYNVPAGTPLPPATPPKRPGQVAAPAWDAKATMVQRWLAGRIVKLEQGTLRPYDAGKLTGVKYYGIMFSAGWCGPCREFAPQLLENYRRLRAQYPEFELVLVSDDHSAGEMLDYMREEKMPWPAVKYSERDNIGQIARLAGPGIPCLVLVDGNGKVLAHSFKGDEYLGPGAVLEETERVLRKNRGG